MGKNTFYKYIVLSFKEEILDGTRLPCSVLPPISLYAEQNCVSNVTVKRAYEELERDGFIETSGRKSFVVGQKKCRKLREKELAKISKMAFELFEEAEICKISADELNQLIDDIYEGKMPELK